MADYKVWKLSQFTGGLNSFTDQRDLSENEFAEFIDIYSAKRGVIKPIGQAVNNLSIPPRDITGSLIQGSGFYNYNSDYTFQSEIDADLHATYTQLSELSNDVQRSTATFNISSCLWLFEKTFPVGGTLTFTPKLRAPDGTSVTIGNAINVITGNEWLSISAGDLGEINNVNVEQEEAILHPDTTDFWNHDPISVFSCNADSSIFQGAIPYARSNASTDNERILEQVDKGGRRFGESTPEQWATILNRCWKLEDNTPGTAISGLYDNDLDEFVWTYGGHTYSEYYGNSAIGPFSPHMFHVYNNHPDLLDEYYYGVSGEWNQVGPNINLWNDSASMLGGKTGAPDTDRDLIPLMGNHERERDLVVNSGKAAGYLNARWAFGFWNGQRYATKAAQISGCNIDAHTETSAFYMPSPSYAFDHNGGHEGVLDNFHNAAYLHMQACLMWKIVDSINNYAGSGTTDKWTAKLVNPVNENNTQAGIKYTQHNSNSYTWESPYITIESDPSVDAYLLNDYEVLGGSDILTASSLKPSSGAAYPVSGTTPEFIETYAGDESTAFIDSLIRTSSSLTNSANDKTIEIRDPFDDFSSNDPTIYHNEYTYVMNILRVGLFIKIENEIMRIVGQNISGNSIEVERGNSTGWGNKTNSTIDTHTSGQTIKICNHGIGWEAMGGLSLPSSLSEWHVPLIPIVLEGDTKTHGGTTDGGRFLGKLELTGLGSGDVLRIRFGPESQTYYFTTDGDFSALGTSIENSFNSHSNYHAKSLGEHYDSNGHTIIFYNTPSTKRHTTVNEALTSSTDTSLIVASATGLAIGDVLAVGTELVYVQGIASTTLTVIRGVGGTSAPSENHQWPVGTSVAKMPSANNSYDTTFEHSIEYGGETEIHFRGDDEHIALLTQTDTFDSNYTIPGTDGNRSMNLYKTELNVFSTTGGTWLPGYSIDAHDANTQSQSKFDWVHGQPVGKIKSFIYHVFNNNPGSETEDLISGNWANGTTDFNVSSTSDTSAIGTGCTVDIIPTDPDGDDNFNMVEVVIALSGNNYAVGDTLVFTDHLDEGGGSTITCEVSKIEGALVQYNDPVFWNESNRLRMSDGNLILPNSTKWLGFVYNEKMFKTPGWALSLDPTNGIPVNFPGWANQTLCPMSGILVADNDKIWRYSVSNAEISNDAIGGLNVRGDAGLSNNLGLVSASRRRMLCRFERIAADANIASDWTGDVKFYASAVYDDGSQGLPTHCFTNGSGTDTQFPYTGGTEGEEVGAYRLKLHIGITTDSAAMLGPVFPDARIVGIHLYMASSEEGFEQLWSVGQVSFFRGFEKSGSISSIDTASIVDSAGNVSEVSGQEETYVWNKSDIHSGDYDNNGNAAIIWNPKNNENYVIFDTMPKVETFEAVNGFSFTNQTLSVRYKAATVGGRRSFVGNVAVTDSLGNTEYHNDRMVVSPVNQLDIYPYPGNVLDLDISDGDKIVALSSLGDKILQFKERIMYIINISTGIAKDFYVEERFKYRGVKNKNHICETSDSVFWFNQMGAFLYDGETINELFIKDGKKDGELSERIDLKIWEDFISEDSICGYNPKSREIFIVKNTFHTARSDGDAYIYNEITDTWTFSKGKFFNGFGRKITNFINKGDDDVLSFMYEGIQGDTPEESGGTTV